MSVYLLFSSLFEGIRMQPHPLVGLGGSVRHNDGSLQLSTQHLPSRPQGEDGGSVLQLRLGGEEACKGSRLNLVMKSFEKYIRGIRTGR